MIETIRQEAQVSQVCGGGDSLVGPSSPGGSHTGSRWSVELSCGALSCCHRIGGCVESHIPLLGVKPRSTESRRPSRK